MFDQSHPIVVRTGEELQISTTIESLNEHATIVDIIKCEEEGVGFTVHCKQLDEWGVDYKEVFYDIILPYNLNTVMVRYGYPDLVTPIDIELQRKSALYLFDIIRDSGYNNYEVMSEFLISVLRTRPDD